MRGERLTACVHVNSSIEHSTMRIITLAMAVYLEYFFHHCTTTFLMISGKFGHTIRVQVSHLEWCVQSRDGR